jgi:hypothetical protein
LFYTFVTIALVSTVNFLPYNKLKDFIKTKIFVNFHSLSMCHLQAATHCLPIDERIKQFVHSQVEDGIINSSEVRRHTEAFAHRELFDDKDLPSRINRRYFPSKRDYVNMI